MSPNKQEEVHLCVCVSPWPSLLLHNQNRDWLAGVRGGLKVTHIVINLLWILIYLFIKCGHHPDGKFSKGDG